MDNLETILNDRLELIERLSVMFRALYPESPCRMLRGPMQKELLGALGLSTNGFNRRAVTEALKTVGYKKVKTRGILYYRKVGESPWH